MGSFSRVAHHPILSSPAVALCFTALSLLLLVLVLLSVPGPIRGLYWFSVAGETTGDGDMSAGVLGWCMTETANCTYAPLSENPYLSSLINTGEALTVRITLPLACYWMIVTLVAWVVLSITSGMGYKIRDLDSITRHLRFAVIEACVLCISLFGNVLCWLAFGFGRQAFMSVQNGGGSPRSGQALETTAVAATISLLSLFFAAWGLHLRMKIAQKQWKEEAVMVRRRSMALSQAGNRMSMMAANGAFGVGGFGGSISDHTAVGNEAYEGKRWTDSPEAYYPNAHVEKRGSLAKDMGEEEELEASLEQARRNSRDQQAMINRASMISPHDTPYAAANQAVQQ